MTLDRRAFLRSTVAIAGGLVVGDAALEAFARLTHVRKSFPSALVPKRQRIWNVGAHHFEADVPPMTATEILKRREEMAAASVDFMKGRQWITTRRYLSSKEVAERYGTTFES